MDITGTIQAILEAVHQTNWRLVAALVLILFAQLVRTYGSKLYAPLASGKWAVLVVVATGAILEAGMGIMGSKVAITDLAGILNLLLSGTVTGLVSAGVVRGVQKVKDPA